MLTTMSRVTASTVTSLPSPPTYEMRHRPSGESISDPSGRSAKVPTTAFEPPLSMIFRMLPVGRADPVRASVAEPSSTVPWLATVNWP